MINKVYKSKVKNLWYKYNDFIMFLILSVIFMSYTIFIAFNIKTGIIPDEITHNILSNHFSTTFGIPSDVRETYTRGVYIAQNPFLYYWINGRIINILNFLWPSITYWKTLISLRIINAIYALVTVIFCYLLSKELIKNKWWQLLPTFLLTNTTMFVFLAGGVNYDNLTNLFCMAGLYFLARVLNHRNFLYNSFSWMICIALGTLTKYTVLPLVAVMSVVWLVFLIKHKNQIFPIKEKGMKVIILGAILIAVIIGNLSIYGYNLLFYEAILPPCEFLLREEQCNLSPLVSRLNSFGLEQKLSIIESIKLGYPGPLRYFIFQWVPLMLMLIFGIQGHMTYYSAYAAIFHLLLNLCLIICFAMYLKNYILKYQYLGILIFYTVILFIFNYNKELEYGFKHFFMHGRYIFPIIGIAYVFITKIIMGISKKSLMISILILTVVLYIFSGPLIFLLRFNMIFSDWFI